MWPLESVTSAVLHSRHVVLNLKGREVQQADGAGERSIKVCGGWRGGSGCGCRWGSRRAPLECAVRKCRKHVVDRLQRIAALVFGDRQHVPVAIKVEVRRVEIHSDVMDIPFRQAFKHPCGVGARAAGFRRKDFGHAKNSNVDAFKLGVRAKCSKPYVPSCFARVHHQGQRVRLLAALSKRVGLDLDTGPGIAVQLQA